MPYITSIAQMGREEGLQQGLQRGRQEGLREGVIVTRQKVVLDALEIRFGQVPDSIRESIEAIQDEARLRSLHQTAIQAESLEAFARAL